MIERVGVRWVLYRAMRYKTLEEIAGKYGLTVDLDETAQLAEWESRLKKLLEAKQQELPNAKNPSLRHKVERECAEVGEACKFVSQQNSLTKLRRCIDEDKQELFEHELRKADGRSILPSENEPGSGTNSHNSFAPFAIKCRHGKDSGCADGVGCFNGGHSTSSAEPIQR